ncbi:MAG: tRNA lysidine(34) synthetase TilS [Bryobacterales bacterium]|nr:tRNA lysidine(34) synthetase TilS [Bryobacterales bacterium]
MARGIRSIHQFERAVADEIERWGMLPNGIRVGVAVSGGADSVALLRVLAALQANYRWHIEVLHLNHNLRGSESDADEAFVRHLAESLSLPVVARQIAPGRPPVTGVEEWGRQHRKEFFLWAQESLNLGRIATGHHRGDQAETVLFRLLRGAGSRGLGGIEPITPDGLIRPLLSLSRDEIRAYLLLARQEWREDASNRDHTYSRNALRHRWLPDLAQEWNPGLEAILANTAEQLRDESRFLNELAESKTVDIFAPGPYGWVGAADDFGKLAVALQRTVILNLGERMARGHGDGDDAGDFRRSTPTLGFQAVETVRRLWTGVAGSGRYSAKCFLFERSGGQVRATIARSGRPVAAQRNSMNQVEQCIPEHQPGRYALPGSLTAVDVAYLAGSQSDTSIIAAAHCGYTGGWSLVDSSRLCFPVTLRLWREGDLFQHSGSTSKRKLKVLFQRSGVPVWRRNDELVLESAGVVVWTRSFGVAAEYTAAGDRMGSMAIRVVPSKQVWESSSADATS